MEIRRILLSIIAVLFVGPLFAQGFGGSAGVGGTAGFGGGFTVAPITVVNCATGTTTANCGTGSVGSGGTVQTGNGTGGISFTCSAGDGVIVGYWEVAGTTPGTPSPGVSDSASNSGWLTSSTTPYGIGNGDWGTMFINPSLASSVTYVQVGYATTGDQAAIAAICVAGGLTGFDFAQINSNPGGSTSIFNSTTYTTGYAREIVASMEDNQGAYLVSSTNAPAILATNLNCSSVCNRDYALIYTIYSTICTACGGSGAPIGTLSASTTYGLITRGVH